MSPCIKSWQSVDMLIGILIFLFVFTTCSMVVSYSSFAGCQEPKMKSTHVRPSIVVVQGVQGFTLAIEFWSVANPSGEFSSFRICIVPSWCSLRCGMRRHFSRKGYPRHCFFLNSDHFYLKIVPPWNLSDTFLMPLFPIVFYSIRELALTTGGGGYQNGQNFSYTLYDPPSQEGTFSDPPYWGLSKFCDCPMHRTICKYTSEMSLQSFVGR